MNRVAADGFTKTKSFASFISLEMEKDFFVGILNQPAYTSKSTISVCCFGYGSASDPPTRLIDLNVCILLRHPPLPAVQRDMLKLKPPLFSKQSFIPTRPSLPLCLYLSHSLPFASSPSLPSVPSAKPGERFCFNYRPALHASE